MDRRESGQSDTRRRETRRFETWLVLGAGFVGLFAMFPIGRLLADKVYVHVVDQRSLDQLRGAVPPGEGGTSLVAVGLFVLPPLVGVLGFLLVRALRASASARFVERSIASGRVDPMRSPTGRFTALAWALLVVGLGGGLAVGMLAGEEGLGADGRATYALAGTWRGIVLGVATWAVAVVTQSWAHRRRHEIDPLLEYGVIERVQAPEVEPATGVSAFAQGLHAFVSNLWIAGLFLLAAWLQATIDGDAPSPSQMVADLLRNVLAYPAGFAVALLVVLWLSPLRWVVRGCLRDSSTRVGLGLLVGGSLVGLVTSGHWAPTVAAALGMVVIAVTMLRLMDLGPQPWLGILFLSLSWWFGASYDVSDRQNAVPLLPVGVIGWAAAIATLAFAVFDIRRHWLSSYGTRTVAEPA